MRQKNREPSKNYT